MVAAAAVVVDGWQSWQEEKWKVEIEIERGAEMNFQRRTCQPTPTLLTSNLQNEQYLSYYIIIEYLDWLPRIKYCVRLC